MRSKEEILDKEWLSYKIVEKSFKEIALDAMDEYANEQNASLVAENKKLRENLADLIKETEGYIPLVRVDTSRDKEVKQLQNANERLTKALQSGASTGVFHELKSLDDEIISLSGNPLNEVQINQLLEKREMLIKGK